MRIALCLHGLFNSLTDQASNGLDGFEYIKKNILSKGDIDVYIHSWDVNQKEKILQLYNPKKYVFENQKDFSEIIKSRKLDTIKNTPRPPLSVLSHLYSVSEVMKLPFEGNLNYDIIIKSRFDLGRINRNTSGPGKQNPFPVQCIKVLENIEKDKLYLADWNHFHMGPPDMWFYGSPEIMNKFITLYDVLQNEMRIGSDFHNFAQQIENNPGDISNSIAFYKFWMIKNGLWDKIEKISTEWE